mmetsp:Transcript_5236/g.13189  ORF Transcript_5236/g.13189 Transcript_5236/m.13189 type:complete len:278 (+) Transcript_5236:722-1555(+)
MVLIQSAPSTSMYAASAAPSLAAMLLPPGTYIRQAVFHSHPTRANPSSSVSRLSRSGPCIPPYSSAVRSPPCLRSSSRAALLRSSMMTVCGPSHRMLPEASSCAKASFEAVLESKARRDESIAPSTSLSLPRSESAQSSSSSAPSGQGTSQIGARSQVRRRLCVLEGRALASPLPHPATRVLMREGEAASPRSLWSDCMLSLSRSASTHLSPVRSKPSSCACSPCFRARIRWSGAGTSLCFKRRRPSESVSMREESAMSSKSTRSCIDSACSLSSLK